MPVPAILPTSSVNVVSSLECDAGMAVMGFIGSDCSFEAGVSHDAVVVGSLIPGEFICGGVFHSTNLFLCIFI